MKLFYDLLVYTFEFFLSIYSFFNNSIREWNNLRFEHFSTLTDIKKETGSKKIILMHCASLGEYEQGIPLIKAMKLRYSDAYYILSFFSPSGYNYKKDTPEFDKVIYLPFDSKIKMEKFTSILKPYIFIGVKYEFWLNLLLNLIRHGTKIYYISVLLNENSFLFKWYGKLHLNLLKKIDFIFVQDERTKQLLSNYGIHQTLLVGDTRIANVLQRKESLIKYADIEKWKTKPLIVYASVYPSDHNIFKFSENLAFNHIIVPHKVDDRSIDKISEGLNDEFSRYSSNKLDSNIIILDTIGMLFNIYQYADFVYVGGGFEKKIHNTLEPAVFYKPISFGPKYHTFIEAEYFIKHGLAREVACLEDFQKFIEDYTILNNKLKDKFEIYFNAHRDSIKKIMDTITLQEPTQVN